MKTKIIAVCLFIVVLLLGINEYALAGYGYGDTGEDPLIVVFKGIVREAKKPEKDWDAITKIVKSEEAKFSLESMRKFFNIDLTNKFEEGLKDKDLGKIVDCSANLIFLSMMEKYELVLKDNFKEYVFNNGRLAVCEKYYKEIFKGNVLKYDEKNKTNLNDTITKSMQDLPVTMGSPSKFGVGGVPPDPAHYKENFNKIKESLLTVFPTFEK